MNTIDIFKGKYAFLSNFYNCKITYEDITYQNTEAAFQAQKEQDQLLKYCYTTVTPSEAKRMGRICQLRSDWEEVKDQIMYEIVKAKFEQNLDLQKLLIETGDAELIEGTTWHDNYWGNCTCPRCKRIVGKNQLGKILMKVREELKRGIK